MTSPTWKRDLEKWWKGGESRREDKKVSEKRKSDVINLEEQGGKRGKRGRKWNGSGTRCKSNVTGVEENGRELKK